MDIVDLKPSTSHNVCELYTSQNITQCECDTALEVLYKILGLNNLSEPDDEVSVQLLYRNALDIHCKHTASHLHDVEVNVASVHDM